MGWQNVFAAVLQAGDTTIIDSNGTRVYNGTPAAGNLIYSVNSRPFPPDPSYMDPFGNLVMPNETLYTGLGPTAANEAYNINGYGISTVYTNPAGQGNNYTEGASFGPPEPGSNIWSFQPGALYLTETPLPNDQGQGADVIYAEPVAGRPVWFTGGNPVGLLSFLDRTQTDGSHIMLPNNTAANAVTHTYSFDTVGFAVAGTVYTLRTWFDGVWGNQRLRFYASIGGINTPVAVIDGVFVPAALAGDQVSGWIELQIAFTTPTAARAQLFGVIQDNSVNSGNTNNATGCVISSPTVIETGLAGGMQVRILAQFLATAAGQELDFWGSTFTRKG